jgi:hypothetical protein
MEPSLPPAFCVPVRRVPPGSFPPVFPTRPAPSPPGLCFPPHQGWAERPVFGKIRYMNYAGCKRKFDIKRYCARVDGLIREAKAKGMVVPAAAAAGAPGAAAAPKSAGAKGAAGKKAAK